MSLFPYPRDAKPRAVHVGDAVQLSAGGPVMTVYDLMAGNWLCCNYLKGTDMMLLAVQADSVHRVERVTQGKPA